MSDSPFLGLILFYSGLIGLLIGIFRICSAIPAFRKNRGLLVAVFSVLALYALHLTTDSWLIPWLKSESFVRIADRSLLIALYFCLAVVVDLGLKFLIWNGIFPDGEGGTTIPNIIRNFVSFTIYLATAALILHFLLDRPITAVIATSGLVALILGYSAQSTLAHVFSGLGINMAKVFEKGDWIQINGETGKVIDMNWRFLTVETYYGNWLTIPNSSVGNADIKNFSRPLPYRGVILPVLIEGGASPQKVKDILLKATLDAECVLKEPDPAVAIAQFQDNGILYEVWYYTTEPDEWEVNDQILSGIWYALNREGIATSLSDVAIRQMPASEDPSPPISHLAEILNESEIFSLLTAAETEDLAGRAKRSDVGFPEVILPQGEASESLYLIEKGTFDVVIRGDGELEAKAAALGPGDMFGEISFLTGEPSTAEIRARNEGIIYQITKEMLRPIFEKRPEMIDELGGLMAKRRADSEKIRSELSDTDVEELDSIAKRLTTQLRSLFGLG